MLHISGQIGQAGYDDADILKQIEAYEGEVTKLSISWCDGVTGSFVSKLPSSVQVLEIGQCRLLNEKALATLKKCDHIQHLTLGNWVSREPLFDQELPPFTGACLSYLPPNLQSLKLQSYALADEVMAPLAQLKQLSVVELEYCPQFTPAVRNYLPDTVKTLSTKGCSKFASL